ncbi:MAG: hypothetical protein UT08_C0022G0010 [Candidatus Woesebacteria bacterium GW2011_GWB1_38_8]|uniref:Uncharacterized protein n=1 Tax=Candidatus Woesebacteria bacterium GW2011_GWB1_38_8 TaxID=1618570 RepID=A0A0G0KWX1_9BACT|nr:MAG: hypothetical protein UT08_C0022G0010 [Candidatus Woesebacteria bacterium GW2011_GWB1_38_8]
MENKQKISYLLLGVLIGVVVFVSFNSNNITSKVVELPLEVTLINCVELERNKICDVQYPNGIIVEKAYREVYDGNT